MKPEDLRGINFSTFDIETQATQNKTSNVNVENPVFFHPSNASNIVTQNASNIFAQYNEQQPGTSGVNNNHKRKREEMEKDEEESAVGRLLKFRKIPSKDATKFRKCE
jgi:hypothetical protein